MTLETIRNVVDSKIKKMYLNGKSLEHIKKQLKTTSENFKKLLDTDDETSPRGVMIKNYCEISDKRAEDLEFIDNAYNKLNIKQQQ